MKNSYLNPAHSITYASTRIKPHSHKILRDQEIYILYFFYKIQIRDSHSL